MTEKRHGPLPSKTYVRVWVGLILLTGVTVSVAGWELGRLGILAAVLIAGIKSILVLSYFMHLKSEEGLFFRLIIPGTLFALLVLIGIVFTDVAYR